MKVSRRVIEVRGGGRDHAAEGDRRSQLHVHVVCAGFLADATRALIIVSAPLSRCS